MSKTLKSIPPTHTPAILELFSEEYTGIAIPPDLKPEVVLGIITFPLAVAAFVPEMSALLLGVGGVLVAIGIVYLVVSWGLLKGKGWAWSVTVIVSYIQIVTSIIAIASKNYFAVGNLLIAIAIVYFLYRPQSKAFFGKRPNAWV